MLTKGYTATEIDERLKVSQATVYTVKYWLEDKGKQINKILSNIAKRDDRQESENLDLQREAEVAFCLRHRESIGKVTAIPNMKKIRDTSVAF